MWRKEDDIQTMLRDSAEEFFGREHDSQRVRGLRGEIPGYQADFWLKMAELGWAGLLLPEEDGGAGLGLAPALTLAHCMGEFLVPEPFVSVAVISATLLDGASGEGAVWARAKLASGEAIVLPALAAAEGAAPALMADGDRFRIDGTVRMVPDWAPAAMLVTECRGPDGTVLVLVDTERATAQTQRMADGTWSATAIFDGAHVQEQRILLKGAAADAAISLARARGVLALCAQLDGMAGRLLSVTREYVGQRRQFDRALAEFQALRHGIVDLYIQHELTSASWRSALERLEQAGPAGAAMAIGAAKARASTAAMRVAKAAVQYHGAFGYTEEADIGLYLNAVLRSAARMGNASEHLAPAAALYRKGRFAHA